MISVVKIIDKMSANDPIVKEAFVSISINSGLSLKRKVLVTTVLMTAAGTFVFLEKRYPLIKLVKNTLYTIAYPIFIKVKACKSIFHRTSSTDGWIHNFFRSKSDFLGEFKWNLAFRTSDLINFWLIENLLNFILIYFKSISLNHF